MKFRAIGALFLSLIFFSCPLSAFPDSSSTKPDDSPQPSEATPQVTPTAGPSKPNKNIAPLKALFLHKPMPSPSWGKVIQYHREQILALSEKNRETLHEFLFQDDEGIIRTATYHENASGDGYWEVWIWDQP